MNWTEQAVADLRSMAARGFSSTQIAEALGTTRCTVGGKASRLGLKLHGAKLGLRGLHRPWTAADIANLRELIADGCREATIAAALGRTGQAVADKARRLGLQFRRPSAKPVGRRESGGLFNKLMARRGDDVRVRPLAETQPVNPDRPLIALRSLESRHCRWPIGDPGTPGFGFCGCDRESVSGPYCAEHHAIASAGRVRAVDLA